MPVRGCPSPWPATIPRWRARRLVVAGLPGAPRGAHATRACRLSPPRHLRLLVRRGVPVDQPDSRRLPAAGCSGSKAHRGASAALRCRSPPWSRAHGPLLGRLRHRGPVRVVGHAVPRRGGLDRRRRQGPGGHAARGRAAAQLTLSHQRGQEEPRRACGGGAQRPAGDRLRGRRGPWWLRWYSTSWRAESSGCASSEPGQARTAQHPSSSVGRPVGPTRNGTSRAPVDGPCRLPCEEDRPL